MEIKRIDPFQDKGAVDEIIKIYQAAFGGEPWNEGWKCTKCQQGMPLNPMPNHCSNCTGNTLEEYWPYERVFADFGKEMRRENAQCLVATIGAKVVGFAWGYEVLITKETIDQVAQHLDVPELSQSLWGLGQTFFYLDEVAVLPKHQKDGIGKRLVQVIRGNRPHLLLRTLEGSRMFHLVRGVGGHTVFSISRGRVIMHIP